MVTFPMTFTDPYPGFQGYDIFEVEYRIRTMLLKDPNRKAYTIYRMMLLSMTLSDLWLGFQGHDIFWSRISYIFKDIKTKLLLHKSKLYLTYGMLLFGDLDWHLNASRRYQHQLSFLFQIRAKWPRYCRKTPCISGSRTNENDYCQKNVLVAWPLELTFVGL